MGTRKRATVAKSGIPRLLRKEVASAPSWKIAMSRTSPWTSQKRRSLVRRWGARAATRRWGGGVVSWVAGGPRVERFQHVVLLVVGAHHQDPGGGRLDRDLPGRLDPGQPGQAEVEQDHVGLQPGDQYDRLVTA